MPRLDRDMFLRLCRARDLLREPRETPLSVREVARCVAISPFHFIRRFESVFGTTPHRFRQAWKIERAKRLLAMGELSVTQTCMAVGYSSLGSFSALFTQVVGMTPQAYRRQFRGRAHPPGTLPPELAPGCLTLMGSVGGAAFRNPREA